MAFSNAVNSHLNRSTVTRTDNGMKAHANTGNAVLDLFTNIGTARGKDITHLFIAALAEDVDLTLRTMLYARDIRGGSGERQTFRNLLAKLDAKDSVLAAKIMHKIPELGRWDDLFTYTGENRQKALEMYANVMVNGVKAKTILETIDDMSEEQCQTLLDEMQ